MKVALTGATGFIGAHILTELQDHGHEVTALVCGTGQAEMITSRGGTPLGISDLWIYGDNTTISEESPLKPPALVAWNELIDRRVLDADGMRGVVIVSSVAYGDGGGGIPELLLGSPRDADGNLIMLGEGRQHWSTVHVADLARAFRHALEDNAARGRHIIADGRNPTVAELTQAAAAAAGAHGAVPGSDEEARARLGDYLAEALLLDQGAAAAKARDQLGWSPTHPGLVEELRDGSYRKLAAT